MNWAKANAVRPNSYVRYRPYSYCNLEIWGRAKLEATRRRKSDWNDIIGVVPRVKIWKGRNVVSRKSPIEWVNMRDYNFFVSRPKFIIFSATSERLYSWYSFSFDPFRRYSRSKSKVVRNRAEYWTFRLLLALCADPHKYVSAALVRMRALSKARKER